MGFFFCFFFFVDLWVATFSSGQAPGGLPQWEAAGEKCVAVEVAGWVVHPWLCYASALASVFQFVPNTGYGQPLSKEESEPIERGRQRKEREWKSWLPNWITPSFFLQTFYCQDHGDFLFSLILREKRRGRFETKLLCPQHYSCYQWPAKHTLLCHEWCKCCPPRIDALWIYFQSCLWVKLTVCGPINKKICTETTQFVASSPCLVDFMPSLC